MKLYLVKDSLTTEQNDEITTIINLCDECAEDLLSPFSQGLSIVREVGDYTPTYGAGCYLCGANSEDDDRQKY